MTIMLTADATGLPTWHQLTAAIISGPAAAGEHRIAQLACALAKLHRKRWPARRPAVAASRRRCLVAAIDEWVANHRRATATSVGPSAGALVDEMTRAGARARALLATTDPADDEVHAAWTACAVLADQRADLIAQIPIPYAISTTGAH
ncbi:DUF4254 domain-containing protein [Nocardia asteroides]|uniref:DUF4254 domain-containing protein n=1 Tax=Nocardia asteroides TaxID=1824 RepID=UPI0037C8548F